LNLTRVPGPEPDALRAAADDFRFTITRRGPESYSLDDGTESVLCESLDVAAVHAGRNVREALEAARRLSCTVASVPRTREVLMTTPSGDGRNVDRMKWLTPTRRGGIDCPTE
jgi:hypothetical protein